MLEFLFIIRKHLSVCWMSEESYVDCEMGADCGNDMGPVF